MTSSLWSHAAQSLLPLEDQPGYPLSSGELTWREFLARHFPIIASSPFAPRHVALWEWFDALERGTRPRPRVEIWPRGGAKSSTVELACARVCAKLSRRFVLYVSDTQDQADLHVSSITALLEQLGAKPMMSHTGRPRAWRRNQLRTENGFNVAAFGLDAAARGIKIEQFRPDLIVFDDVDSREDSVNAVEKKVRCITQSILPAGSNADCAVLFAQNLIHANSIASQLVDGRAKFLLNREIPTVEGAVIGLKIESTPPGVEGQPSKARIIAGEATWEGQSLAICEEQINLWGLETFLRESNHDVKRGGEPFFPSFEGVDYDGAGTDGRHVMMPLATIPSHWTYFAGLDNGFDNPWCCTVYALDDKGRVYAIGESHGRQLELNERVARTKKLITDLCGSLDKCIVYADPSMWNKKDEDRIGPSPNEAFWAAGIKVVKANNNRIHGWDNIREYLGTRSYNLAGGGVEKTPVLRIFKGRCPILCNDFERAVSKRVGTAEDLDDDADIPPGHMDAVTTARYALMSRPITPEVPKEKPYDPYPYEASQPVAVPGLF